MYVCDAGLCVVATEIKSPHEPSKDLCCGVKELWSSSAFGNYIWCL